MLCVASVHRQFFLPLDTMSLHPSVDLVLSIRWRFGYVHATKLCASQLIQFVHSPEYHLQLMHLLTYLKALYRCLDILGEIITCSEAVNVALFDVSSTIDAVCWRGKW